MHLWCPWLVENQAIGILLKFQSPELACFCNCSLISPWRNVDRGATRQADWRGLSLSHFKATLWKDQLFLMCRVSKHDQIHLIKWKIYVCAYPKDCAHPSPWKVGSRRHDNLHTLTTVWNGHRSLAWQWSVLGYRGPYQCFQHVVSNPWWCNPHCQVQQYDTFMDDLPYRILPPRLASQNCCPGANLFWWGGAIKHCMITFAVNGTNLTQCLIERVKM